MTAFFCAECNRPRVGHVDVATATVASMAVPVENVIDSLVVILIRMSSASNVA